MHDLEERHHKNEEIMVNMSKQVLGVVGTRELVHINTPGLKQEDCRSDCINMGLNESIPPIS
jgi:hypothetical protein